MAQVNFRYFIAEGEKATQVAEEGLQKVNESRAKHRALLNELSAYGTYSRHRNFPATELVFEGKGESKAGLLKPTLHIHDEKVVWAYRPDLRTKIGKEISKKLAAVVEFDFSDFACKAFGVSHSTIGIHEGRMAMFSSGAGYLKKALVFTIPFGGDMGMGTRKEPQIPAEFREIKKSEYEALKEMDI